MAFVVGEATPFLQRILCYPRFDGPTFNERLAELSGLGVARILETGAGRLDGFHVLGKGCVSVVVTAQVGAETLAVKIRRTDADRPSMHQESKLLVKANLLGVGPRFRKVSNNFLLMELVDGLLLPEWLLTATERRTVTTTLMNLLQQCLALDLGGIDHGELSRAHKQVLVRTGDNVPFIIDFESASQMRRPSNLNSITQYIFIRNPELQARMAQLFPPWNETELLEALREYKKSPSPETMDQVAKTLGLCPV